MTKELKLFLAQYDDDTLNDGAYWALLEEGVMAFNTAHGTNLDPHNTVLEYLTGA
jgi:hypothetical protein